MKFWSQNSYYIDINSAWSSWNAQCEGLQSVDASSLDLSIFREVNDHVFGERASLFHSSGEPLTLAQRRSVLQSFRDSLVRFQDDIRAWPLHVYYHNDKVIEIGSVSFQFAVRIPPIAEGWSAPWLPVAFMGRPYIATALDVKYVRDNRRKAVSLMTEAVRLAESRHCERDIERGRIMLDLLRQPLIN